MLAKSLSKSLKIKKIANKKYYCSTKIHSKEYTYDAYNFFINNKHLNDIYQKDSHMTNYDHFMQIKNSTYLTNEEQSKLDMIVMSNTKTKDDIIEFYNQISSHANYCENDKIMTDNIIEQLNFYMENICENIHVLDYNQLTQYYYDTHKINSFIANQKIEYLRLNLLMASIVGFIACLLLLLKNNKK